MVITDLNETIKQVLIKKGAFDTAEVCPSQALGRKKL